MRDELLIAVEQGDVNHARLLLSEGSSPHEDEWGLSLLDEALDRRDEPMARLLMDHGARLADTDGRGRTRLHASASSGRYAEGTRLLLRLGLDPHAADHDGWTPLHYAAAQGDGEVVTALLAAGAERSATTKDGKRPADMARINGHTDLPL